MSKWILEFSFFINISVMFYFCLHCFWIYSDVTDMRNWAVMNGKRVLIDNLLSTFASAEKKKQSSARQNVQPMVFSFSQWMVTMRMYCKVIPSVNTCISI